MKPRMISRIKQSRMFESAKRKWFKFSRGKLSLVGLGMAVTSILIALLAPWIAPHPEDVTKITHLERVHLPPCFEYPFGTDYMGRDILSRTIFGFRFSLMMAGVVLTLTAPVGVVLGLIAGARKGIIETIIMRTADIFIAVPALVLALAVCSVLTPNIFNAMMAVSLMWWPWYTRLTYNVASSLRNEYFVQAAELMGASTFHIIFREIFPNCLGPILTKITLDVGWVILIGSSLSFVGLGAQPPTPDLGTMVAQGGDFMPDFWWESVFPAMAIAFIIMGFNLLGDGVKDMFTE